MPLVGDVAAAGHLASPCEGPAYRAVSDLLPQLRFVDSSRRVSCPCREYESGTCFAPGCFVCARACFADDPELADLPGPLGTGLLCSSGCLPCCQRVGDPEKAGNSTCDLVGTGC